MRTTISPRQIGSLLENRTNGGLYFCRVRLSVLEHHPELFDAFYDRAEERLGGPIKAAQSIDVRTRDLWVYFWSASDEVIPRMDCPVEASVT